MKPTPLFYLFDRPVYLYGICIAVGIIACLFVFFMYTKKKGMPEKVQDFSFFVALIAIVLGFLFAKLYQAFYDYLEDGFFNFKSAGITAMGGFIGGALTFIVAYFVGGKLYFKNEQKDFYVKEFNKIVLVAPCCITIAHAFGRIGCLMAGCCHGKFLGEEYVFGGMYMRGSDTGKWGYYVPTQLYEALFLFLLFGALTYLYFNRCNITMAIYLIAYGVWRIFIEIFRTDARGAIVLGLAPSQWQSIVFILGGIALIVFYKLKRWPLFFKKEEQAEKS